MRTLKGPAIFLAQFAGDKAPFDTFDNICAWAAGLGYKGVQIPTWVSSFINLEKAATSKAYCDDLKGVAAKHGVEITDNVLYRARLRIPARVPVGDYTAETFLIEDGRVLAGAVRDVHIGKSGFERFVANAADNWSLTYGLFAVAISLLLGWAAALIFRR